MNKYIRTSFMLLLFLCSALSLKAQGALHAMDLVANIIFFVVSILLFLPTAILMILRLTTKKRGFSIPIYIFSGLNFLWYSFYFFSLIESEEPLDSNYYLFCLFGILMSAAASVVCIILNKKAKQQQQKY